MKWPVHILSRLRGTWNYRHEPERFHTLARIYWRFLIIVIAILISCVVGYGALVIVETFSTGEETLHVSGGSGAALNRVGLNTIIEAFSARSAQYGHLKDNPPVIADPSR